MASQTAIGILLGAPAQELLRFIIVNMNKAIHFKTYLEKLQLTLESITPVINEVRRLNAVLTDRPRSDIERLKAELENGKELVIKCWTVPSWNYFKRLRYSKKILKFDKNLRRFFKMEVPADIWLGCKQILVEMGEMMRNFDRMSMRRVEDSFSAAPEIPDMTFGLDVPLKELKMLLFRDDVRVLGLCAPGGCGKTTLASVLCRDRDVSSRFKKIYFLTVSSSPDFKVIVQKLSEQMFPTRPVPHFVSEGEAILKLGNLMTLMETEPTLLVLDDVWEDSVVRKFFIGKVNYKILVTSRTQCQAFDYKYSLKMLNDADAMALFCHSVFPQNEKLNYEEPDRELLIKIVRGCKGLPLALKVIGHSLHQQPAKVWQQKERMMSSCSIFKSHSDLLSCLATSLDFLTEEVQECFMDLGSFPEDERIPASSLIDIWVELYGIDEVDAYINLLELSTLNLVSLIEFTSGDAGQIDGNLNGLFVTQHDLLRDLAIYQSQQKSTRLIMKRREESLPWRWSKEEHQFQNARLVSIQTGEMSSSNWYNMHFPEAEVLILDFSATKYTLPPFVEKMEKLKVLIIINRGRHCTQLNYLTKPGCLSTLRRVRLQKVVVPSLNEIGMPLKDLQKISLFMCEVGQALRSYDLNFPYMLPNLVEVNIDYCNDLVKLPQGICDLVHLQKLSITNCHDLLAMPEGIGSIRDLEVLRLHACTGLAELPNTIQKLQKLRFLDISECLSMERLPEGMGELHGLEKLDMRQCLGLRELPTSIMKLVDLKDVICDDETAHLWQPFQCHLHKLKSEKPKDINLFWLGVDLNSPSCLHP
ncbi:putative disease resistance protein At5g47280 [Telopea speciosissima]|uniref:putative disease resistance protein At5g47280 n=1 Tax=Telopea speciosissima TaxID=54955 RepID=UPI001CC48973|nr:putative disease resistance protein At5g47280 [Telopea speciosissima]